MAKLTTIIVIAVCLVLGLFSLSFAQGTESLTITTYHPSPYGSYNELTSNRMKIGSTYSQASTPFVANSLLVEGNIAITKTTVQAGQPNGATSGIVDAYDVYVRAANGGAGAWMSQGPPVPSGTLCGAYNWQLLPFFVGTPVPCMGVSVASGCPAGYTQQVIYIATFLDWMSYLYTCAKN